jgi:hypothetical protein
MSLMANVFLLEKAINGAPPQSVCVSALRVPGGRDVLGVQVGTQKRERTLEKLAAQVSSRFNIGRAEATSIVHTADAFSEKTFPTTKDLLAIIAVESSFKPKATNQGAFGLMQVQLGQHKHKVSQAKELMNPVTAVAVGASILKEYYQLLGNVDAAIISYQAGPGAYQRGEYDLEYLRKVNTYRKIFGSVI